MNRVFIMGKDDWLLGLVPNRDRPTTILRNGRLAVEIPPSEEYLRLPFPIYFSSRDKVEVKGHGRLEWASQFPIDVPGYTTIKDVETLSRFVSEEACDRCEQVKPVSELAKVKGRTRVTETGGIFFMGQVICKLCAHKEEELMRKIER